MIVFCICFCVFVCMCVHKCVVYLLLFNFCVALMAQIPQVLLRLKKYPQGDKVQVQYDTSTHTHTHTHTHCVLCALL